MTVPGGGDTGADHELATGRLRALPQLVQNRALALFC
jgi:hypothetical protein